MRLTIVYISIIIITSLKAAADVRLSATVPPVEIEVQPSSGLNHAWVTDGSDGLSATATSPEGAVWYMFGVDGASEATRIGQGASISLHSGSHGYIAEEGDSRTFFWVTDWNDTPMTRGELHTTLSDCATLELSYTGAAPRMTYHGINGRPFEIDRRITLTHSTLEADEEGNFAKRETVESFAYLREVIAINAPLCATALTLRGDRFLTQWQRPVEAVESGFTPTAVAASTTMKLNQRDAANEQTTDDAATAGSAPLEATFTASTTEATAFTEWQIATDDEFTDIIVSETDPDFTYTFREAGNFFARFTAANADGSCLYVSDTYNVSIGESRLSCPNAFSHGDSEGVNDEWKVSYRSLVEFECHIFNRWGVRLATLTDPSQGWDGRYKGRLVDPGAYYYVIKARGADGKSYNLGGDINIIRRKR